MSGNYFDVLNLHPYLGRFFHSFDEHAGAYLEKSYPQDDGRMNVSLVRAGLYGDTFERPIREFVVALMLLAALILLAACANLASLFAARAADRSREAPRGFWAERCCSAGLSTGIPFRNFRPMCHSIRTQTLPPGPPCWPGGPSGSE